MTVDIKSVKSYADVSVHVKLSGLPDVNKSFGSWTLRPFALTLKFRVAQDAGGELAWVCFDARVTGHRVLKPGKDGQDRLGVETGYRDWSLYGGTDLATGKNRDGEPLVPEWLAPLINELRPSGIPSLAGDL